MAHDQNPTRTAPLLLAAALLIPVVAVATYIATRSPQNLPADNSELTLDPRSIQQQAGGVPRPRTDLVTENRRNQKELRDAWVASVGKTPTLDVGANSATQSLAEALRRRDIPGRVTALMEGEPFDLRNYQRDPKAYLDVHEPARVWQTAQPGDGVPVLTAVSERNHSLLQGESVRLQVKTAPKMPVTWTSFDLGSFENGLTSITVGADETGVAETTLHASPGTIGEVNVLAGSPAAAEHVRFVVFVKAPGLSGASK